MFALAALVLQIAVSFGHVHLDGVVGGAPRGAAATAHAVALAQGGPRLPAQNSGDDDYCAICASIFLVSTSFVAAPPELPVPLAFGRIEHAVAVTDGVAATRLFAFQSRAPPAA